MKINNILNEFVKESSKKLDLNGIIQFGSSTYSKDFHDIDLVFFSKDEVFLTEDYLKLFEIIDKFEKKFKEVIFDIAGGRRKKKGRYSISIIPFQMLDIKFKTDEFFMKNLVEDQDKKVLFGKNPLPAKILLSKKKIIGRLSNEINHNLRKCLDDKSKHEEIYGLFKVILRLMLVNKNVSRKDLLLSSFKEEFSKIKLPISSKNILNKKLMDSDFEDVLKFSEDCLRFLIK